MANWKWLKLCIKKIEASLIDLILPIEYLINVHHLGNVHMTCKEGQFDGIELPSALGLFTSCVGALYLTSRRPLLGRKLRCLIR